MSFPRFPHWSFAASWAVPTLASEAVFSPSPVLVAPSLLLALNAALLARVWRGKQQRGAVEASLQCRPPAGNEARNRTALVAPAVLVVLLPLHLRRMSTDDACS